MSFTIKCDVCGNERKLENEFLQLGTYLDIYARDEGKLSVECDGCTNLIESQTV